MNTATKALDENLLDMMAVSIGKRITNVYTQQELDSVSELHAKNAESCKALADCETRCAVLQAENDRLKQDITAYASAQNELTAAKIDAASSKSACVELRARIVQLEALLVEEPETEEPETEEATGCEIDVVRGGDDRIRSLKVRYTK